MALITSREGAALGDFSANLERYGFSVALFDAHVEGRRAIGDILRASHSSISTRRIGIFW